MTIFGRGEGIKKRAETATQMGKTEPVSGRGGSSLEGKKFSPSKFSLIDAITETQRNLMTYSNAVSEFLSPPHLSPHTGIIREKHREGCIKIEVERIRRRRWNGMCRRERGDGKTLDLCKVKDKLTGARAHAFTHLSFIHPC